MNLQIFVTFKKTIKSPKAIAKTKSVVKRWPLTLPAAGLIVGGLIVLGIFYFQQDNPTLRPSDSRIVYLFEDGQRQTLNTKAESVGELVDNLDLNLSENDLVEPALDTPIVEDNFRINVYRARPVTIIDGDNRLVTLTARKSARMVASEAGLKVKSEDLATFEQGSLKDNVIGERIVVARATPILLNLYGVNVPSHTRAVTVGGLMQEKRINLSKGESITPSPETKITSGMQIFVLREGAKVEIVEEEIPMPEKFVNDPTLSLGATAVRQNGSPGLKAVTYLVSEVDGNKERKLIGEVVIDQPVAQITARGSTVNVATDKAAVMSAAGVAKSDHGFANYIISHENALWCPTRWQGQSHCPDSYAEKFPGSESAGVGYGLCQSTPANKMSSAGNDWRTNPVTQMKWCHGYALERYGSWAAAYNFKRDKGWW